MYPDTCPGCRFRRRLNKLGVLVRHTRLMVDRQMYAYFVRCAGSGKKPASAGACHG